MDDLVINDMKIVPCVNSKYVQPSRLKFNQNGIIQEWDYINVHDSVAALLLNTTRDAFILVKQFRPAAGTVLPVDIIATNASRPCLASKSVIKDGVDEIWVCLLMKLTGGSEEPEMFKPISHLSEIVRIRQLFLYSLAVYMHQNRKLNEQEGEDKSTVNQDATSQPFKAAINDAVTYELCAGIVDKSIPLKSVMKEEIFEECGYNVPELHLSKVFSAWGSVGFAGSLQTLFFAEVTDDMKVNEGGGNRFEGEKIEVYYLPRKDVLHFLFNENLPKPPSLMAAFFWYLNTHHSK